jgi:hypothetical protein
VLLVDGVFAADRPCRWKAIPGCILPCSFDDPDGAGIFVAKDRRISAAGRANTDQPERVLNPGHLWAGQRSLHYFTRKKGGFFLIFDIDGLKG